MPDNSLAFPQTAVISGFADDPDFQDLLEMFAESISRQRQELEASHRDGDVQQLQALAHTLKGAGGGYGFPEMTTLAAELENACKSDDRPLVDVRVPVLLDYLGRIRI
jgi:HPt (histidine-containing phosphotransfer) domain-containing protein